MVFVILNSATTRTLLALLLIVIIAVTAVAAVYFGKKIQKRNEKSIEIDGLDEEEAHEKPKKKKHKKEKKGKRKSTKNSSHDDGENFDEPLDPDDTSEMMSPSDFVPDDDDDDISNTSKKENFNFFPYLNDSGGFDERSVPELEFAEQVNSSPDTQGTFSEDEELPHTQSATVDYATTDDTITDDVVADDVTVDNVKSTIPETPHEEENKNGPNLEKKSPNTEEGNADTHTIPQLGRYEEPQPSADGNNDDYLLPPVPKRVRGT